MLKYCFNPIVHLEIPPSASSYFNTIIISPSAAIMTIKCSPKARKLEQWKCTSHTYENVILMKMHNVDDIIAFPRYFFPRTKKQEK